jgi:ABC-type sugar transport system ATPase subunit
VGTPTMNIIDIKINHAKGEIRINDKNLKCSDTMRRVLKGYKKEKARLGIRPSDVAVKQNGKKINDILLGEVMMHENFGDRIVHTINTQTGILKDKMNKELSKKAFNTGERVSITFELDKTYLFDADSGSRIFPA